jgi:hypothetical protein
MPKLLECYWEEHMQPKALDLFQAFQSDSLPRNGGYIVSSFFDSTSSYSIYEIVSYDAVKSIHASAEGLTFQSDGLKLYILFEPPGYAKKHIEPFRRDSKEQIPLRFSELRTFTAKDQTKVYVSKEPQQSFGSFTILKPTNINFSLVFFKLDDILDTMEMFFTKTLNKEAGVRQEYAKKAAKTIVDGINALHSAF